MPYRKRREQGWASTHPVVRAHADPHQRNWEVIIHSLHHSVVWTLQQHWRGLVVQGGREREDDFKIVQTLHYAKGTDQ